MSVRPHVRKRSYSGSVNGSAIARPSQASSAPTGNTCALYSPSACLRSWPPRFAALCMTTCRTGGSVWGTPAEEPRIQVTRASPSRLQPDTGRRPAQLAQSCLCISANHAPVPACTALRSPAPVSGCPHRLHLLFLVVPCCSSAGLLRLSALFAKSLAPTRCILGAWSHYSALEQLARPLSRAQWHVARQ